MSVRRGVALQITLVPIAAANRPSRLSGLVWQAGEVTISLNGGTFVGTTNLPSEIGTTGRYVLALTSAEMDADWVHIIAEKASIDPIDMQIGTSGHPCGTVTDAAATASSFTTSLSQAVANFWKDVLLVFTTGALSGQVKKILAYDGTTKAVTVSSPFTGAPASGDRFMLINI